VRNLRKNPAKSLLELARLYFRLYLKIMRDATSADNARFRDEPVSKTSVKNNQDYTRMLYRFGTFQFDELSGELWRDGVRVRLEPQPARALALLLSRAGDLVTRDEMRRYLWGGDTHVDFDRGLAYCIGQVRSALSDSGETPRFVQTLPRRGFRFIAPVEKAAEVPASGARPAVEPAVPSVVGARETPSRAWGRWFAIAAVILVTGAGMWAGWPRLFASRPIVAVAIFDNETGIPEHDRLAAGAADVMVDALTALGPDRVGVIGNAVSLRAPRESRNPSMIRRETGAGYLVIGQVQKDDGGIRMVTHLIRMDDETHLWVTRVVRAPEALAGIEAVSAERLAEAVRLHVIERRPDAPRFTR
jgi:DNA-binding winged helix-turn-helix (wHTH) protein/TolB-like protein